jgi:hypothetical protein
MIYGLFEETSRLINVHHHLLDVLLGHFILFNVCFQFCIVFVFVRIQPQFHFIG